MLKIHLNFVQIFIKLMQTARKIEQLGIWRVLVLVSTPPFAVIYSLWLITVRSSFDRMTASRDGQFRS